MFVNVPKALLVVSLSVLPLVDAHLGPFAKGMFCRNGNSDKDQPNSNTVVNPLFKLQFKDYFFGGGIENGVPNECFKRPPLPGEFLELPAGGSFQVEIASNRAFTTFSNGGKLAKTLVDGKDHPEFLTDTFNEPKCIVEPNMHTHNKTDVSGSAFAISYNSDFSKVTQENMVVFTTNKDTPFLRLAKFDVPKAMPACPPEGCLCGWGWVPGGCGRPDMYLSLFKCKVTGATSNVPIKLPAKAPVLCNGDPSKCVSGPKQMVYWNQLEKNNFVAKGGEHPTYNLVMGFKNGAQDDIFEGAIKDSVDDTPKRPNRLTRVRTKTSTAQSKAQPTATSKPKAPLPKSSTPPQREQDGFIDNGIGAVIDLREVKTSCKKSIAGRYLVDC